MENLRAAPRQRVLKGGHIVFNDGASTIDCVVRDISTSGARLKVESPVGVPEFFVLRVVDGAERKCRVVWRRANLLGITFTA